MKRIISLVTALILLVTLTACQAPKQANAAPAAQQPASTKIEVTDLKGRQITLDKVPERIVSLSPANTEILFAVGAGDKVVGVTSFDDYPEQVKNIEKIGSFEGPNLEMIQKAKPDVVLAGGYIQEDLIKSLEQLNIPVVSTEATDFNSIFDSIKLIGKVSGNDKNAEAVVAQMKDAIAKVHDKVKDKTPKSVFYVVWTDPLTTAGAGTFIDDVIKAAGGVNVAEKVQYWAKYSPEQLVKDNPEYLLSPTHNTSEGITADFYKQSPIFKNLNSVKNGKVYIMSDDNIISRPGPRIVQAIEEVAKVLHGDDK
jgi:iron complex transport system substrate-binding protein